MSVRFHRLVLTGPEKPAATLDFNGASHLVFGPTDTGKSYVVYCLRYALGSNRRPPDVSYSAGYTRLALQVITDDGRPFTFYRDMTTDDGVAYEGFHDLPPQAETAVTEHDMSSLLVNICRGASKKIITKAGTRENFAASDLRYYSLFDEIETLDNIPLLGKDTNLQTRRKSALSLILSGVDDSEAVLPSSTKERTLTKGHLQALEEEIASIRAGLPEGITKIELVDSLGRIDAQLAEMATYLQTHTVEIQRLKTERRNIQNKARSSVDKRSALIEASERFKLLQNKYLNDLGRLKTISTAASIFGSFESRPCPLCHTDIEHQARHKAGDDSANVAAMAAAGAEIAKIVGLQDGLKQAQDELEAELVEIKEELVFLQAQETENLTQQAALLAPTSGTVDIGIARLSARKAELSIVIRDYDRLEQIQNRRTDLAARAKRQKQKIHRDLSQDANQLCTRIQELLHQWGVPDVKSVYFEEQDADIKINQRQRISFGKGKRGIFLAAYITTLMEHALENGSPHLGCVAIDSPVVTYKDPKYGNTEDALDIGVKDRFYAWLANRTQLGQVIVLENEEPEIELLARIPHTEFLGINAQGAGRKGFFPI